MSDRFFIDSNICLYLFGDDIAKAAIAEKLFIQNGTISTQVLAETANVLLRKFNFNIEDTREAIGFIRNSTEVKAISIELFDLAFDISIRYKFSFYDCMIIAAALDAECTILYSEDMQHGQLIENKLTVINPFK